MKNLLSYLPIAMALTGCVRESIGIHKIEAFRDRYVESVRGGGVPVHAKADKDTVIYMTAVEFPENYDWHRDTSFGNINGRIVLFRDSVRVMEIPAGQGCLVGLDPDLHHFSGGHVYTESCTMDGTVIGRDGERLFSYPGRELLCGLLVEGRDVYTLGRSRDGGGFSLRRNGEELFSRPDGGIASHISARPDYPTGALYRDSGHLYFSYWQSSGGDKVWYVVEDGTESRVAVPDGSMYDIRIRDGTPDITLVKSSPIGVYTYIDGSWKTVVAVSKEGRITVYSPLWPTSRYIATPMLFLSFRNAFVSGKHLYMALNPVSTDEPPFLWRDGKTLFSLDINGFVTEVSLVEESSGAGDKEVGIDKDFH